MLAKSLRTKRKSASAERCVRPLGATIDMATPDIRTSNHSSERGIFALMFTKRQPGFAGVTGFCHSPGIAEPNITPNATFKNRNYSSEKDRKGGHGEQETQASSAQPKGRKQERVRIDREETLQVDPALLPGDAQFKGHEDVLVQDLLFRTDNVLFHKEKFYSPSEQKTYLAEMPRGYQGQFGPQLKAFVCVEYFVAQVSEPKIVELLGSAGIIISAAEVSNLLIKQQEPLHAEKAEIVRAGLESSPWQQTDDTGTRVNGVNEHCHILCNPLYTAFFTLQKKDRLSVIDVLSNQQERRYLFNEQALASLQEKPPISQRVIEAVAQLQSADVLDERKS